MSDGSRPAWIAVDWGTSRLRAWALGADNHIIAAAESDAGMSRLDRGGYEPALLALVAPWLPPDSQVPVFACGMVGSRQGWIEARYRPVPCAPLSVEPLARPVLGDCRLSVQVVAGLRQDTPPDVMRGEETQIAGFLAGRPDFDGVVCLPGTHTKWAHVSAGEVVSFQSFMTGEIFALLAERSVLGHVVAAEGWDRDAFSAAVETTLSQPERLAARLFAIRAEALLTGLEGRVARARLSGLLIGAELAAARPYWLGREVAVVGAIDVAGAYGDALRAQGVSVTRADGGAMTLAGLSALRDLQRVAVR